MGFITALMVFVFPLGLPVLTLVGAFKVARSEGTFALRIARGLLLVVALTVLLGPAIERNGAGSFALPWWLLLGSQSKSYAWQYAIVAFCIVAALSALVSGYRYSRSR